jgi:cysteine desulfurase
LNKGASLAISSIEHPSISEPAQQLHSRGHALHTIAVDSEGIISQNAIDELIQQRPQLACLMLANNETGVIQPIAHYAQQLNSCGIAVHSDAVQAVGKMAVDFNALGVSSLSLSAHKLYGAKGAGALIVANHATIKPLLWGGGQERNYRAGTENVAAIVAFGHAAQLAKTQLSQRQAHLLSLRQHLEQRLLAFPRLTIFARHAPRLANTVQFGIEGIDGEMLLMQLDSKGVAVSSGSACASGGSQASPVLLAMGIDEQQARTAIRISLGMNNTLEDIEKFITLLSAFITKS